MGGAVAADDAEDLALLDLEADIAQGPVFAARAVAVVILADLEPRIGPAAHPGPPAARVLARGTAADEAEAVVLLGVTNTRARARSSSALVRASYNATTEPMSGSSGLVWNRVRF